MCVCVCVCVCVSLCEHMGILYIGDSTVCAHVCTHTHTQDLGVLTWSNPGKRLMVVSPSGHDEVRRFWRRQKNN